MQKGEALRDFQTVHFVSLNLMQSRKVGGYLAVKYATQQKTFRLLSGNVHTVSNTLLYVSKECFSPSLWTLAKVKLSNNMAAW